MKKSRGRVSDPGPGLSQKRKRSIRKSARRVKAKSRGPVREPGSG
jgi:hypothetical protein